MAKGVVIEPIIEAINALTEQLRIANFFYTLRYFNDEETDAISKEFKKICETSGKFWSAPEVAKRFCDCVKTVIAN